MVHFILYLEWTRAQNSLWCYHLSVSSASATSLWHPWVTIIRLVSSYTLLSIIINKNANNLWTSKRDLKHIQLTIVTCKNRWTSATYSSHLWTIHRSRVDRKNRIADVLPAAANGEGGWLRATGGRVWGSVGDGPLGAASAWGRVGHQRIFLHLRAASAASEGCSRRRKPASHSLVQMGAFLWWRPQRRIEQGSNAYAFKHHRHWARAAACGSRLLGEDGHCDGVRGNDVVVGKGRRRWQKDRARWGGAGRGGVVGVRLRLRTARRMARGRQAAGRFERLVQHDPVLSWISGGSPGPLVRSLQRRERFEALDICSVRLRFVGWVALPLLK
jgi:hypothetical protein